MGTYHGERPTISRRLYSKPNSNSRLRSSSCCHKQVHRLTLSRQCKKCLIQTQGGLSKPKSDLDNLKPWGGGRAEIVRWLMTCPCLSPDRGQPYLRRVRARKAPVCRPIPDYGGEWRAQHFLHDDSQILEAGPNIFKTIRCVACRISWYYKYCNRLPWNQANAVTM